MSSSSDHASSPNPQLPNAGSSPGQDHEKKPTWRSRLATIIILLLICGGVVWGIKYDQNKKAEAAKQAPARPQQTLTVTVESVAPTDVPVELTYLGQTEASQTIEIRARVKGFIEKRQFTEGAPVAKDQVLFTIERSTFQATLDAAEAKLAQAQANYDQADRQVKRYEPLVQQQAASRQELDDWKTNRAVANANIQSAKAGIEQAKLDLGYTTIRTPIRGVIGRALQDVGNYVGTGDPSVQSKLAVVEQIDPIYVTFPVSENDLLQWKQLAEVSPALSVQAELINGQMYDQSGKLDFVDVRVDSSTGTAKLRAVFSNANALLRPGQFVRVHIRGVQQHDVLTVPQQAVLQTPSSAMVFVVNGEKQAQSKPVKLGQWAGDRWIITDGLSVGDKVITNHMKQMRPGVPVKIADASSSSSDVSDPATN